jgi:hypothetical protein
MRGVEAGRCVCLLALLLPLLLLPVVAKADEAADAFNSLFGADLKQVAATPDPADDVALAARLVAAAETASKQPALLVLLCDKAWELGKVHPTGQATAVKAMELLARCVPECRIACQEKVVIIRQLQYDAARGDERTKAGRALVASQQALMDLKADAGDLAGANECGNRALLVIEADLRYLQARLNQISGLQQARKQVAELKGRLAAGPTDAVIRVELLRLYLVDLDNPAEAAKYVSEGDDPAMRKYVPAAARGLDQTPELACLELGDWYYGLAAQATPAAKGAMLGRAHAYYRRFLDIHTVEDLDRTKATLALNKIQDECAKSGILMATPPAPAGVAPLTAAKTVPAGQWLDLLPQVDLTEDAFGGTWVPRPDGIASVNTRALGRLGLPVVVQGDYEWETRFVGAGGMHHIAFIFSVGKSRVIAQLNDAGGRASGLALVNGKEGYSNETAVPPTAFDKDREYTVLVRVQTSAAPAKVALLLDGRPYISWTGAPSALSLARLSSPWANRPGSVGLGATTSAITFRASRLRMLSGEARLLRTGAPLATGAGKAAPVAQWLDVAPMLDLVKDIPQGAWKLEGGTLSITSQSRGRIVIPVMLPESYELQMSFTRASGQEHLGIILPAGGSRCMVSLSHNGGAASGLAIINGKAIADNETAVRPGTLANAKEHALDVKVVIRADRAEITVLLNGGPYIHWEGPQSALSVDSGCNWAPPGRIAIGAGQAYTLRNMRLQVLSGNATFLRPAGAE